MDIKQLRYFTQLYQDGQFSLAANHLFITPQALSKSIKHLEEEVGQLLTWSHNHFSFTPLGELLYHESISLLKHYEQMETRLSSAAQIENAHLRIVTPFCTRDYFLDDMIARFQALHPHVSFDVEETADLEAETLAENSDVDLSFCIDLPHNDKLFQAIYLVSRPLCLMVNINSPLIRTSREINLLRDVPACDLCCADARFKIHELLHHAYAQAGKPTDFQLSSEQLTPYSRVLRGECVCISFADVIEATAYKTLVPCTFVNPSLSWDIYMLIRQDTVQKPIAHSFAQFIQSHFASGEKKTRK